MIEGLGPDELEKQAYLDSLYLFAKYCLGYKDLNTTTHLKIASALQDNTQRKLICVPRGTFKCLCSVSIVYTSNGKPMYLKDVKVGEHILSWENGMSVKAKVIGKDIKFNQPSLRLSLRSGRQIVASGNHPFMKITGWTNAEDLKVKDRIAGWAGKVMEFGEAPPKGHPWLLGMFIGDGACSRASLSMFHEPIINKTLSVIKELGFNVSNNIKGSYGLSNGIKDFLRLYDIEDKTSWTKSIPTKVWSWSLESRREFIAAYLSCDGTVNVSKKTSLTTVSKELAYGFADLLKTIGVFSTIKYYKYKYSEFYRVNIIDKQSQENLLKCPLLMKNRPVDVSPLVCIYKCVPKEWRIVKKPKQSRSRKGTPRIDNNYATSFDKFKTFAKEIDMEWACDDEMYWDEIVKIEKIQTEHIDIEVEGTHTFIAEGLITHNSSLASVAYPIWRLLHDPNDTIMIDSELYKNSKNFLREIKGHYEHNEKFIKLFGNHVSDSWNEAGITVKTRTNHTIKEHSIIASGIEANKTSLHVNCAIADDLSSYQNCRNHEVAKKTVEHYGLYTSIVNPGGTVVIIGTRYSEIDIIGFIIENELGIKDGNVHELKKIYCSAG